jgi:hypothetical protein
VDESGEPATYDALPNALTQAIIDQTLDSRHAREATIVVQDCLRIVYHSYPAVRSFHEQGH